MRNTINRIFLLTFLSLSALNAHAAQLDTIAAVVNENAITQSQLNEQTSLYREQLQFTHAPIPAPAILRQKALQHMIDTQLQMQLAKKQGIIADENKVNRAISTIAQQNGLSLEQLKSKVAQQGMSYDKYRAEIQKQMMISELQRREVAPKVSVSEQEITDFLRLHGNRLNAARSAAPEAPAKGPVLYHVLDILIPVTEGASTQEKADALQKAKTILNKLRSGASVDVQSSDLGWREFKALPDIFEPLVKTMQPGSVSEPLLAPNGYHLIQLAGVRGNLAASAAPVAAAANFSTHVRHILIKTTPLTSDADAKNRLARIRDALLHGASFAKLAEEDSQDPVSAIKGGDLGWVNPGMLDPAFEQVMNNLKIDEISAPFKSAFGWHLAQVLARKSITNDASLQRTQVREILFQHKYGETLENWLQQLRSQSYIKIMGN